MNQALKQIIRIRRIEALPQFFGQKLWEGDLAEMREDNPRKHRAPGRKGAKH